MIKEILYKLKLISTGDKTITNESTVDKCIFQFYVYLVTEYMEEQQWLTLK